MSFFRKYTNVEGGRGLLKISLVCSSVEQYMMLIRLPTSERKWWYYNARCLVQGSIEGAFATKIVLVLSSNTVHRTIGFSISTFTRSPSSF